MCKLSYCKHISFVKIMTKMIYEFVIVIVFIYSWIWPKFHIYLSSCNNALKVSTLTHAGKWHVFIFIFTLYAQIITGSRFRLHSDFGLRIRIGNQKIHEGHCIVTFWNDID